MATRLVTDGACSGNGSAGARGGWAAILTTDDGRVRELSGAEASTTNNRMEMMGAIEGLRAAPPGPVTLVTDSRYLADGLRSWMDGWKKRGWVTSSGGPVKNKELWQELDTLRRSHPLTIHWVRGHAGHPENERADELARAAIAALGTAGTTFDDGGSTGRRPGHRP